MFDINIVYVNEKKIIISVPLRVTRYHSISILTVDVNGYEYSPDFR